MVHFVRLKKEDGKNLYEILMHQEGVLLMGKKDDQGKVRISSLAKGRRGDGFILDKKEGEEFLVLSRCGLCMIYDMDQEHEHVYPKSPADFRKMLKDEKYDLDLYEESLYLLEDEKGFLDARLKDENVSLFLSYDKDYWHGSLEILFAEYFFRLEENSDLELKLF